MRTLFYFAAARCLSIANYHLIAFYTLDQASVLKAPPLGFSQFKLTLLATRLVIETLEPLPKSRKCFRLINGVLAERTVKDVLPALKTNSDGLKQVLEELLKQYKIKQDDMDNWKVR